MRRKFSHVVGCLHQRIWRRWRSPSWAHGSQYAPTALKPNLWPLFHLQPGSSSLIVVCAALRYGNRLFSQCHACHFNSINSVLPPPCFCKVRIQQFLCAFIKPSLLLFFQLETKRDLKYVEDIYIYTRH